MELDLFRGLLIFILSCIFFNSPFHSYFRFRLCWVPLFLCWWFRRWPELYLTLKSFIWSVGYFRLPAIQEWGHHFWSIPLPFVICRNSFFPGIFPTCVPLCCYLIIDSYCFWWFSQAGWWHTCAKKWGVDNADQSALRRFPKVFMITIKFENKGGTEALRFYRF